MFISETWKSSKDVIENDDEENGIILVRGVVKQSMLKSMGLVTFNYYYNYTVKFYFKDNKYKIVVNNVNFSLTSCDGNSNGVYTPNKIEPIEEFENFARGRENLSKKDVKKFMDELKRDLQLIVDNYEKQIKEPSLKSDW